MVAHGAVALSPHTPEIRANMARHRNRSPRSKDIVDRAERELRADQWAKTVSKIGVEVVRWAGIGYCVYRASLVLIEWSGETTVADVTVGMKASGPSGAAVVLGLLAALAGVLYGKRQAQLRRNTIRQFESRVKELETLLDERRSSSGLTTSGDTPREEE